MTRRRPTRNDSFEDIFSNRNVTRLTPSTRRKPTPPLGVAAVGAAAAVGGGIIGLLVVLAFIVLVFAAIGAVLGWLGMLIAGILGTSVAFLSVAWPIGTCVAVIVRFLRS